MCQVEYMPGSERLAAPGEVATETSADQHVGTGSQAAVCRTSIQPELAWACNRTVHGCHLNVIASALTPDCCIRSNHWRALSNWPPLSHADISELYVMVFGAHSSLSSCSCSKVKVLEAGPSVRSLS